MTGWDWTPEKLDLSRPSPARVYDYLLGGGHHFAVDRALAEQFIAAVPDIGLMAAANRAFLGRAVRYLVDVGVRQFLDLGSGLSTVGSVHQITQRYASRARVVYVDIDPVAVACSTAVLAGNGHAEAIREDLRHPEAILSHPYVRRLLELDQPVAVLLVGVLHFVADADDPYAIVARLREQVAAGSYLVISHVTGESRPEDMACLGTLARQAGIESTVRSRTQVQRLFTGFSLVDPGLVWAPLWRPDTAASSDERARSERSSVLAGVGHKP